MGGTLSGETDRERSARFDAAAARLLRGGPNRATAADITTVLQWLTGTIRRRYPSVEHDEIAQEALARVFALAPEDANAIVNPAAYMTRVAQHLAVDAVRRATTLTADTPLIEVAASKRRTDCTSEDEMAVLLDRSATHASVTAAIGLALAQEDFLTVRVVTVWLDLADESGSVPSSRDVAERANASHTSVNKALARFRALIQRSDPDRGASSSDS